jgi:hypothetical protein
MKRWEILSEQQGHNGYLLTKKSVHMFSKNLLIAQNRFILDKLTVAVLGFRHGALEIFSFLKSGVASVGDLCPTFLGETLLLFPSSVKSTKRYVAPGIKYHYVLNIRFVIPVVSL